MFFLAVPPALLIRRTRPLLALLWSFVPSMTYGVVAMIAEDAYGGLVTMAVALSSRSIRCIDGVRAVPA